MTSSCSISIIIPVYNNEDTLSSCINSILTQRFKNYELILVNNGSTDASAAFCEDYREKDPRVLVIHMDRETKGTAWNRGLNVATGRYILLAEATDAVVEPDALGEIYELLSTNLDVIFLQSTQEFTNMSHISVLRKLSGQVPDCLWDKLIRRGVIADNDILFSTDDVWESADFCMKLYLHAETYGSANFPYYNARPCQEEVDFSRIMRTLALWAGPAEFKYGDYKSIIHRWMADLYWEYSMPKYSKLPKEARQEYKSGMRDFMWLLDVKDTKLPKILCALFGPFAVSSLLRLGSFIRTVDIPGISTYTGKKQEKR